MNEWISAALGLAGGVALAWWTAAAALPRLIQRSRRPERLARLAFAGTAVALLPAVLLSIVVGATLAGAIGVAVVFALSVLLGLFAGVLLDRVL